MSLLGNPTAEKQEKRRESWRAKARRYGVSPKTLDRWAMRGIISPPEYIRGRKYGNADEEPRLDAAE
jgi:DNA-binding transcriptional MerR regulator